MPAGGMSRVDRQRHELEHDIATFFERDVIGLLDRSGACRGLTVTVDEVDLAVDRVTVSLGTGDMPVAAMQVALVAVIAVLAQLGTTPARPVWLRYAVLIAEAAAIALVVVTSAPGDRPSIVYLAVPPIVSAFAMGAAGLSSAIAVEGLVLLVGTVLRVRDDLPTGVVDLIVVLALGVALGLGAILTTHLRQRIAPPSTDYDLSLIHI